MKFEIDFAEPDLGSREDYDFLIEELGAYWEKEEGDLPYVPLIIEIKDFGELEKLLEKVDKHYSTAFSAIISFDPPTIYLE